MNWLNIIYETLIELILNYGVILECNAYNNNLNVLLVTEMHSQNNEW